MMDKITPPPPNTKPKSQHSLQPLLHPVYNNTKLNADQLTGLQEVSVTRCRGYFSAVVSGAVHVQTCRTSKQRLHGVVRGIIYGIPALPQTQRVGNTLKMLFGEILTPEFSQHGVALVG